MPSSKIILLHGLGARPITMWFLENYLNRNGIENTYRMYYPVDELDLQGCVDYVDQKLPEETQLNKEEDSITIIGQSMGGCVGSLLHQKGWNIDLLITVGSPLRGTRFLQQCQNKLNTLVYNFLFNRKMYSDLLNMINNPLQAPPHPYFCFSMSWFMTNFDGCVYKDEARFSDQHHAHLNWTDHRTVFMDPRLFRQILAKLNTTFS